MSELRGCTDGYCIIRKPEGMHTNGGCRCERELRHALGLQDSRRFIHALRERQREVAELREAAQDYMSAFGQALEACGIPFGEQQRRADERIRAALKPHAQGGSDA